MPVDRPYKIVYCTPALYSAGGVERIVSVKANYFAEQYSYDVTIIVTEGIGKPPFFPISDKVNIVNLNIDFEELWNKPFWYKIVLYVLKQHKYKKSLKEELLRLRPDITISTLRREINFLKSSLTQRLFVKWWKKMLVSRLRALDKLVVLTESSVKEWPELDNIVMIPDPLPIQVDSKSPLTSKHVVTIGRYSFEKGYDLLLRSWAIVQKEVPDWHLDIYGMGDAAAYKKQAVQLDIDLSRCHFYGSVSDVQKVYNNCSVFALTSRFEGFGLVLVEAMACGVPVISFACQSGPLELISDGQNGLLVPLGDVSAFAEKLICLIKDAKLRASLAEGGLKTAQSCSLEKVASQWKAMFDNLMRGK